MLSPRRTASAAVVASFVVLFGAPAGATETVSNLGRYLEQYVGDCLSDDPEFNRKGCEATALAFRQARRGRPIRIEVDDLTDNLQFAGFDKRRGAYRLHLTPFFGGREFAITVGKPKPGKNGLPTVKNLPIWVKLPKGEADFSFRRKLERGMVRLELILEPGTTWAIPRRGGDGYFRGTTATLKQLRVIGLRSDAVLAEQKY